MKVLDEQLQLECRALGCGSHVSAETPRLWGDCEGILYTRGSHNVGHAFFIKDRKLHFVYNALGRLYRATGDLDLSNGRHEIGANFEREGRSGRLALA